MHSNLYLINLFHLLVIDMKTFGDKHFKNKLDPKAAYYDYIRSYKLNTSTKKSAENCTTKCTLPLVASEGYRYLKAGLK